MGAAVTDESPRQLVLDLTRRSARHRSDFLVSACNAEAAAWIDRWPDWPEPARGLVIVGPAASGKSHLGAVWRDRSAATVIDASSLSVDAVPECLGTAYDVLVEGLDVRRSDEALFHLYNIVAERSGSMLILSRTAPAQMGIALADLASRLATLPVVTIGDPDEALLAGVMAKHFADRQVTVRDEVLAYLVARMERSFAAAHRLAVRLDQIGLSERRPISLAVARRALDSEEEGGDLA